MSVARHTRKAETRALLIDVATRHFEAHGFDRTTIRGR